MDLILTKPSQVSSHPPSRLSFFVAVLARSFQVCLSLLRMQALCQQSISLLEPALLVISAGCQMFGVGMKP